MGKLIYFPENLPNVFLVGKVCFEVEEKRGERKDPVEYFSGIVF